MADFPRTYAHLDGSALGIFGVGHLGRVIASGLVRNEFPISRLLVCHAGSLETAARVAEAGLSGRIVPPRELTRRSRIILYLVRPQNLDAIRDCELMGDALIISFLAGTPLARIPARSIGGNRVRVMTSAPDTVQKGMAIGGVCPAGHPIAEELLRALRVERFPLENEDDMHAFTALGVCLPIVLACWRAQGKAVEDEELILTAQRHSLRNFGKILRWAREGEPRFETGSERDAYLKKSATPGGVTEAIIERITSGDSLTEALESGIRRSVALSKGSTEK